MLLMNLSYYTYFYCMYWDMALLFHYVEHETDVTSKVVQ